jgi:AraC-like DNA-binding protein
LAPFVEEWEKTFLSSIAEVMREQRPITTQRIDAAEDALSATFLPLRLDSSARNGRVEMHLDVIAADRFTMGRVRFDSELRIRTDLPVDYHIDIPLRGRARSRAGARDPIITSEGSAAVFMPGLAADLTWSHDAEQLLLVLGAAEVRRELTNLLGREVRRPVVFAEKMDLTSRAGRSWTRVLDLIERDVIEGGGLLDSPLISRRLDQVIIDGLLIGHQHNYTADLCADQPTAARRAVRRAIELVQSRPEHPWSTSTLAAEVSVSARSLQCGFREMTGSAPMEYLRHVRLHRVHQDLLEADPSAATVTEIAHRWGFVHLGRFACAYRQRFGTLPSSTIRAGTRSPQGEPESLDR